MRETWTPPPKTGIIRGVCVHVQCGFRFWICLWLDSANHRVSDSALWCKEANQRQGNWNDRHTRIKNPHFIHQQRQIETKDQISRLRFVSENTPNVYWRGTIYPLYTWIKTGTSITWDVEPPASPILAPSHRSGMLNPSRPLSRSMIHQAAVILFLHCLSN